MMLPPETPEEREIRALYAHIGELEASLDRAFWFGLAVLIAGAGTGVVGFAALIMALT